MNAGGNSPCGYSSALLSFSCSFLRLASGRQPPAPVAFKSHRLPFPRWHHRAGPPLTLTFGVRSASFTPTQFAALPHVSVTVHNDHTKACETYSGVPLIDLLALRPLLLPGLFTGGRKPVRIATCCADDSYVVVWLGAVWGELSKTAFAPVFVAFPRGDRFSANEGFHGRN